jgi:hypothetical protein
MLSGALRAPLSMAEKAKWRVGFSASLVFLPKWVENRTSGRF